MKVSKEKSNCSLASLLEVDYNNIVDTVITSVHGITHSGSAQCQEGDEFEALPKMLHSAKDAKC